MPGTTEARRFSHATELAEYRVYRQGDEPRRIDWRVLARTDRAFIRLGFDQTAARTLLVVDASASMAYPPETLEKWHFARRLSLGLASAALAAGDAVGLLVAGGAAPIHLPARSRHGTLQAITTALRAAEPRGADTMSSTLMAAPPADRVVVVSDFLEETDPTSSLVRQLAARGCDACGVHVIHESELAPHAGDRRLIDPEDPTNGSLRRVLSASRLDAYVAAFHAWRDEVASRWRSAGGFFVHAETSEPVAHAVYRIVGESRSSPVVA